MFDVTFEINSFDATEVDSYATCIDDESTNTSYGIDIDFTRHYVCHKINIDIDNI